jgi:O-antigen/teichoic acid export membrane protein
MSLADAIPHNEGFARHARTAWRYGLSAAGPMLVSGAHFAAALMFLRALPPAQFGLLSFLFVVVPFCLSASGALVGAPLVTAIKEKVAIDPADLATYLKTNLVICAAAATVVFALTVSQAPLAVALLLATYAALMALRWFARCLTYVTDGPIRPIASDLVYGAVLTAGLLGLFATRNLSLQSAAIVLVLAAALAAPAFGLAFLRKQFRPGGSLLRYGAIWRDVTRWSLTGVALTEMTANAHAYLVTFISGPGSFAVLAVGALLMRPAALVLSALPDLERPAMARKLAAGDRLGASRSVKEFRTASGAVWLLTILLAGAVLMWFPHLILKKGYDETQIVLVLAIYAGIVAVRTLRGPESVFLQAAGEFKALAGASLWSSVTSIAVTFVLLILVGPIFSLFGILAGDAVMTARIFALTRRWKFAHG